MLEETVGGGARRRVLREELNRSLILDAAEETFGYRGYRGASLREIARKAGFSTAALYLYFENKAHLYGEMLVRRGAELRRAMEEAAQGDAPSLQQLHDMAQVAIEYYRRWPHFARLVAHAHATMLGSPLSEWQEHPYEEVRRQYQRAMELEANIIRGGQRRGEIRAGDPHALAHLFSVMVNSYLAIGAPERDGAEVIDEADHAGLTVDQLHGIIDSAFRAPTGRQRRSATR